MSKNPDYTQIAAGLTGPDGPQGIAAYFKPPPEPDGDEKEPDGDEMGIEVPGNTVQPKPVKEPVKAHVLGTDEGHVLVPSVDPDGKELSHKEAAHQFFKSGRHLGVFKDAGSAHDFADKLLKQHAAEGDNDGDE